MTRAVYALGEKISRDQGIVIADTKFEFGRDGDGRIILIDEVMTPDSSRFWAADAYRPGCPQPSFDKQPLRDYLDAERRAGRLERRGAGAARCPRAWWTPPASVISRPTAASPAMSSQSDRVIPGWCAGTRPQMCNCTSGNLEIPGSMRSLSSGRPEAGPVGIAPEMTIEEKSTGSLP